MKLKIEVSSIWEDTNLAEATMKRYNILTNYKHFICRETKRDYLVLDIDEKQIIEIAKQIEHKIILDINLEEWQKDGDLYEGILEIYDDYRE